MEPITHFLTGACLGRAGLNRKTALATLTLTLAAEAPDLDVLSRFGGPAFGFAHHRGFTHSILGLPIDAAMVVGFVYLVWHLRGRKISDSNPPPRWGLLFLYACLAGATHILLDFTNAYGVRPFWPFSERWYSWDIVFIFEPIMFTCLVLGLIVPLLFSLIDNEVGAKKQGPRGRTAAALALIAIASLWLIRDFEHRRAIAALQARTYNSAEPVSASAYPALASPFEWYGVVETANFFVLAPVRSIATSMQVASDDTFQTIYKPEETSITLAAKRSYLGRVYLDWAAHPVTRAETADAQGNGYIVNFEDLRYAQMPGLLSRMRGGGDRSSKPLGAAVQLDRNLQVVGDIYGSGPDRHTYPEP